MKKDTFLFLKKYVFTDYFQLLFIILPTLYPLLATNLLGQVDGNAHLYRMASFIEEIDCGQFPPRWVHRAALGVGSPAFMFNWILPYFIVWLFTKIGFSILASAKLFYLLTHLLSALGFYLLTKKLFSPKVAVIGAAVYVYMPYRLFISYHFGSWGEMLFLALIPWVFFFIYLLFQGKNKRFFFLALAFLLFLIFLSHLPLFFVFFPLVAIFIFWLVLSKRNLEPVKDIIVSFLLAFSMAGFSLFPLIFERNLFSYFSFISHDVNFMPFSKLQDLTNSLLRYAIPLREKPDYWGSTYGITAVLVILIGLFYGVNHLVKRKKINGNTLFFATLWFLIFVSLFLATHASKPVWKTFPFLFLVVYPYRFIALANFLSCLLLIYLSQFFPRKIFYFLSLIIVITSFSFMFSSVSDHPNFTDNNLYLPQSPVTSYETYTNMGVPEFFPKFVPSDLNVRLYDKKENLPIYEIISGNAQIKVIKSCGSDISLAIKAENNSFILLNRIDFPSWEIKIDNKLTSHTHNIDGFIIFAVPDGNHIVDVVFGKTFIEALGIIISFVGILIVLYKFGAQ